MKDGDASAPKGGSRRKLALGSAATACALGGSVAAVLAMQGGVPLAAPAHSIRSSLEVASGKGPFATEGRLSPNGAYWEVPGTLFPFQRRMAFGLGQQGSAGSTTRSAGTSGAGDGTHGSGGSSNPGVPVPTGGGGTPSPVTHSGGATCVSLASLPSAVQKIIKLHLSIDGVKVELKQTKKGTEVCGKLPKSLTKKHKLPIPVPVPIPPLPPLP